MVIRSGYVVFIHPSVAADFVRAVEDGHEVECKVVDGELVELGGCRVVTQNQILLSQPLEYGVIERFSSVTSPAIPGLARQPRRGAQWKAERGLAGRRWGS